MLTREAAFTCFADAPLDQGGIGHRRPMTRAAGRIWCRVSGCDDRSPDVRLNTSTPSGFPNGRLLADDVTDVSLRAMAGGTAFTPAFNHSPNNILTDGVDANDRPFLTSFPYVAPPISGTD